MSRVTPRTTPRTGMAQILEIFSKSATASIVYLSLVLVLVRMKTSKGYSDADVKDRLAIYYEGKEREITSGQIPYFRNKFSSISEYMREVKVGFSRFYNMLHNRNGYFWGDRFKSVIVESGETLINCLAYKDCDSSAHF